MNGALATRYSVDIVAMGDDISQQMVKDVSDINGVSDTLYAPAVSVTLEKADGTQPTSALLVGVKNIDQVKQVMRANLGNASIDSDSVLMQHTMRKPARNCSSPMARLISPPNGTRTATLRVR